MPAKKVLLIDDEVAVRNSYLLSMEREGFQVFPAAGAREALRMLNDLQFDLAVVDLHLIDGDGLQLARCVQSVQPNIKTVAISGYPYDEDFLANLKEWGIFGFYHKIQPVTDLIGLLKDA